MDRREVDMSADPRREQFAHFRAMEDPWMGVTAPVDVTDLVEAIGGRPFFLTVLYAVTRAANAVPELRRRLLPDGRVTEYDRCTPSYTAMKPDGVYVYCAVLGPADDYDAFVAEGRRRQAEVLARGTLTEDGDPLCHLFISALPWLPYMQIKAPAPGRDESNPRIFWGRYTRREGRWELPVSLFVNHALADGIHLARFYQALEGELAALSAQFQQENK